MQEYELNESLHSLSTEERHKMRIGNFKGDSDVKTKTVGILKERLTFIYLESVVN